MYAMGRLELEAVNQEHKMSLGPAEVTAKTYTARYFVSTTISRVVSLVT
jgi:hypothetical protein